MSPSRTSPTRSRGRGMAAWSVSIAVLLCRRHCPPGELLHAPSLTPGELIRLRRLQQRLARAKRGSEPPPARTKLAIARLKAREADRRRDWVEKTTTELARRFDTIRVEDARRAGDDPLGARHARSTRRSCCAENEASTARSSVKRGVGWLPGSTIRLRDARTGPGCVHVATMLRLRAYRTRKPQEPSGLRLRRLQCGAVQRRRQRSPQHRRRTGGTSTGRPRRKAVCEL